MGGAAVGDGGAVDTDGVGGVGDLDIELGEVLLHLRGIGLQKRGKREG